MKKKKQTQTTAQHLSLALSSLLFLSSSLFTRGYALNIATVEEFIDFANNVNNGTNSFSGETVYLTNDLDFANYSFSFVPVGKSNDGNTFRGTFDGNGHSISNLNASSGEFRYLGVFGYSLGTTIKNFVVDSSCSFESNNARDLQINYYTISAAGILAHCESSGSKCVVEGCVNMASIEYAGTYVNCSYLGGIVGKIGPTRYNTSITNCVNYGTISCTDPYAESIRIGGIVGEVFTYDQVRFSNIIKNCVNFGPLSQSGIKVKYNLYMGGISGVDKPNIIYENCVSLGMFSYNKTLIQTKSIGCISGYSVEGTFTKCSWNESELFNATGPSSDNIQTQEGAPTLDLSVFDKGPSILDALKNAGGIELIVIDFDSRGGSVVDQIIVILNSAAKKGVVTLPSPVREGYVFGGWYNDTGFTKRFNASELEEGNTTLYARWVVYCNVTFVVEETRNETIQELNSTFSFPDNPSKEGFTFDGWYTDSAFKNKLDESMKVNGNTTLYGRFISTAVRIDFDTKDLGTDEAIRKIEEFTECSDCFTIIEVKEDNGKAFIIIKFEDVSKAKNFVETIKE